MVSLPHQAVLILTGWAVSGYYPRVQGFEVFELSEEWLGQRVTARTYPRVHMNGKIKTPLELASVRKALSPNGCSFELIGHLLRADKTTGELRIAIHPSRSKVLPFLMVVRATPAVLERVNPEWFAVRVRGGLIDHLMVADSVEQVYAPLPRVPVRKRVRIG
jgi:hypothetical protein